MKKITYLFLFFPLLMLAQSKATNPISVQNFDAGFVLDRDAQIATLTMTGPADRWLAVQFGQFSGGMQAGSDVVYFDGNTLVDATHNGIGSAPSQDAVNNWTVLQNVVDSGFRTIIATRPFESSDSEDYDFNYDEPTIGMALARGNTAGSFELAYHGFINRIVNTAVTFTPLGSTSFEQEMVELLPNPARDQVTFQSKEDVQEISFYNLAGALVKKIVPKKQSNTVEISDLAVGQYLVEIKIKEERYWKKLLVE